jgi:thiosulfate dehydrogenase [quinone] large subunit
MSIQDHAPKIGTTKIPQQQNNTPPAPKTPAVGPIEPATTPALRALAVVRIALGLTFLWAFLDKTFGLGYTTSSKLDWINGGSPTKGFLAHVEVGPFQGMLHAWAGTGWADWLFMLALLGIGVALTLGIGMRIAGVSGTVLLALMWIASWPLAQHTATGAPTSSTNPLIDEHLILIVALIAVTLGAAGTVWGFGKWWHQQHIVQRYQWLR